MSSVTVFWQHLYVRFRLANAVASELAFLNAED